MKHTGNLSALVKVLTAKIPTLENELTDWEAMDDDDIMSEYAYQQFRQAREALEAAQIALEAAKTALNEVEWLEYKGLL